MRMFPVTALTPETMNSDLMGLTNENPDTTMMLHTNAMYESPQSPPKEEHLHTNDELPTDESSEMGLDMGKDPNKLDDDRKKDNSELEKYWKAVRDNNQDFTGWTYLLQYVEQENDLDAAREAFDAFFSRYPYCYGYWKKYADLEKKNGNIERCNEVFERGIKAVPLSVDLWLHYLNFYKTQFKDDVDGEEKTRMLFEYAIAAAGSEFKSDRLWEMYIAWENENKKLKNITSIYDRLLVVPTQMYSHHFEKFQEHVNNNLPKEILSTDEFLSLRQDLVNSLRQEDEEPVGGESPPPGVDDDAPPGEEAPPIIEKVQVDEETAALRRKIIEVRRHYYKANEEEVSKRWAFEEGIKRPYFHVKPLERAQLKNWRDYLDFEIESGNHDRIVVLFERCMIACALYEDLWTKYAKYMETYSIDGARNVYSRACNIHLPKKPNIHLAWAAFEERLGNYAVAWEILDALEKSLPGYLPISFRRINLQRRQGNAKEVVDLYKSYMEKAKSKEIASFYAIKFARYHFKVTGDYSKAMEVLREGIKKDKENPKLYLQLIDFCIQQNPRDEDAILKTFEEAINGDLSAENKILFSQRKLEFYEDFGNDIKKLQEAYDEHAKFTKIAHQDKKKRSQPEDGKGDEASKEKKAKVETNGVVASTLATTAIQPTATTDQTAYSYQSAWPGYTQVGTDTSYNYHQTTWNPYSQHYYTGH